MSAGRKNTSEKKDWNTPPQLIEKIRTFFGCIELDPCSNEHSTVDADVNIMLPQDGLKRKWREETIFVNPPYGRDPINKTSLYDWLMKGKIANDNGSEVIFLIPVATNTKHFKNIIFVHASAICFLKDTRLRFFNEGQEDKKGAPMACCLVYFGNKHSQPSRTAKDFVKDFTECGRCFEI